MEKTESISSFIIEHGFEWILVLVVLMFLVYLAKVIKSEKELYLSKAVPFNFHDFELLIPSWWSPHSQGEEDNTLHFHRADTYYDWKAKFSWLPLSEEELSKDMKEIFGSLVSKKHIQFDSAEAVIKDKEHFVSHPLKKFQETDFLRVEGTATEDDEHRIYYDAFVVKDKKQRGILFCESRSSILNGMLEGPYFEEVIHRLTKAEQTLRP